LTKLSTYKTLRQFFWPTLYRFSRLTLILSLHCLVKCKSRGLAVYNNDFILGNACAGSEVINRIATNTINW